MRTKSACALGKTEICDKGIKMGSIKTAMVVLWLTLTLFVAVGSSVLKNQVQGLERRLDAINANIQKDIDIISL